MMNRTFQILRIFFPDNTFFDLSTQGHGGSENNGVNVLVQATFKPVSLDVTRTVEENTFSVEIPRSDSDELTKLWQHINDQQLLPLVNCRLSTYLNGVVDDLFYGTISSVEYDNFTCRITFSSYETLLAHGINFKLGRSCRWDLYGSECQVDKNNPTFTTIGNISSLSNDRTVLEVGAFSFPFNKYKNGIISYTIGSDELEQEIALSNLTKIYLFSPLNALVSPTAQVKLSIGCTKDQEYCKTVFNNFFNFGGVPRGSNWFIGQEAFLAGARNVE